MNDFHDYDPNHDKMPRQPQWRRITWADRVMRVVGVIMLAGFPLSLMAEVNEGVSLWVQVAIYVAGLACSIGGGLMYIISGGRHVPAWLKVYK